MPNEKHIKSRKKKSTQAGFSLEQRTICNGNVVLYQRSDNDARWHARIRQHANKWHRFSTKQTCFTKAKATAEEKWRDIKYNDEHGRIIVSRKFNDVCRVVKRELLEQHEQTGEITPKHYAQVIENYLEPILGDYKCHEVTADVMRKFEITRRKKLGREPNKSTISNHNAALTKVLKRAKNEGYLEKLPRMRNEGATNSARPSLPF